MLAADDAQARPAAAASTFTVLYVGSWGRSGSTLLDLILGHAPGFVSVGELRYLWERGLRERQLCGCGVPVPECPFWSAVLEHAFGGADRVDAVETARLARSVDGLARVPWMRSPWKPRGFERNVRAYREILGRVYRAVAHVSGASVIVDSSKYAAHGLLLAGVDGLDLRVLHLVRDSRAVAYSWMRRKKLPEVAGEERYMPVFRPWQSAVYWSLENVGLQMLRGASNGYAVVRYEDLVAEPRERLAAALERLGIGADLGFLRNSRLELGANHTVAGNPLRFKRGTVPIRADAEWRGALARPARWTVTALTLPLLLHYGFRVRAR